MSHQDLAAVWAILHGRSDIDNIVQELIGRHALDMSLYRTEHQRLRKASLKHIVALKVVFDLQRAYLQSTEPTAETLSSLLRYELLYFALLHLLEIKTEVFSSYDSSLPDHAPFWSLLSQTLLSGIRAIHLQRRDNTPEAHAKLVARLDEVRESERLTGPDDFIVNHMCPSILQDIFRPSQNFRFSEPACGMAELPDFFHGLYPVERQENATSFAVRNARIISLTSPNWLQNALICYDINWSTIAAMIQLCMDVRKRKLFGRWSLPDEAVRLNDLHLILTTRFKMQYEIFGETSAPRERAVETQGQMKALLCSELLSSCALDQCSCLGDDRQAIQNMRQQYGGRKTLQQLQIHVSMTPYWDLECSALKDLQSILNVRTKAITRSNGDLANILQKANESVLEWCPTSSNVLNYDNKDAPTVDDLYVINCPNLHPITAKDLHAAMLEQTSVHVESRRETSLLHNLPITIKCHPCNRQFDVISARKIDPLSKIVSCIQQYVESVKGAEDETVKDDSTESAMHGQSNFLSRTTTKRRQEVAVSPRSQSYSTDATVPAIPKAVAENQERGPPAQNHQPVDLAGDNEVLGSSIAQSLSQVSLSHAITATSLESTDRRPSTVAFDVNDEFKNQHSSSIDERNPSIAPSYTEYQNYELASQQSQRSPIPSIASTPPVNPPQIDRNNYPELHNIDPNNFPQVVEQQSYFGSSGPLSIISDESDLTSRRVFRDGSSQKPKKWQSFFKGGRHTVAPEAVPAVAFFSGGKSLLMWNDMGAGCYDLHNPESIGFRRINARHVRIASGGSARCAVVTKSGAVHTLKIFEGSCDEPVKEILIESSPLAMALSRNDQYLALKFSRYVQVFDTSTGGFFYHELPRLNNRSGKGNHLIAFSNDSRSFIASTRYEPEKVLTYWSDCTSPSKAVLETSAPSGLVGDDGLSSLLYSDTASRGAFLSTFTEQGPPVILNLSEIKAESRTLRDPNGLIGTRIHRAALCPAGTNLVFVNQRNDIFWMFNPFGHGNNARRVASIKRATSVRRDVEIGMSTSDEAHVFWVDKGRGYLMTVGRSGGKSKPLELTIDMEQLVA